MCLHHVLIRGWYETRRVNAAQYYVKSMTVMCSGSHIPEAEAWFSGSVGSRELAPVYAGDESIIWKGVTSGMLMLRRAGMPSRCLAHETRHMAQVCHCFVSGVKQPFVYHLD